MTMIMTMVGCKCNKAASRQHARVHSIENSAHFVRNIKFKLTRTKRSGHHAHRPCHRGKTSHGRLHYCDAGDLVIHPLRVQRGTALMQALKALGEVDDDFIAALEAEQEAPLQTQEREAL